MRINVYKGIGEQSSSQSPAMNFDLTWVILTKLTGCRMSTNKTSDIQGGAKFGRQGHNLNKLGRGTQDGATNIIPRLPIIRNKSFVYWKPSI